MFYVILLQKMLYFYLFYVNFFFEFREVVVGVSIYLFVDMLGDLYSQYFIFDCLIVDVIDVEVKNRVKNSFFFIEVENYVFVLIWLIDGKIFIVD